MSSDFNYLCNRICIDQSNLILTTTPTEVLFTQVYRLFRIKSENYYYDIIKYYQGGNSLSIKVSLSRISLLIFKCVYYIKHGCLV